MPFLIRIVAGSIVGVLLGLVVARKFGWTPRRIKRKYDFLIQTIYTIVFTAVVTLLYFHDSYLGWVGIISLSFLTWLFSVKLANLLARNQGESLRRNDAALPAN